MVSILEKFFREVFIILLTCDPIAQNKLKNTKIEILLGDINTKSKEALFANTLSFQNLNSLNKNYQKWLNLDLLEALSKVKRIGNKRKRINSELKNIIDDRHDVIHKRILIHDFRKQNLLDYIKTAKYCTELVIKHIEKTKKIKVLKNHYL